MNSSHEKNTSCSTKNFSLASTRIKTPYLDQDEFVHKTAMRFGDTNKDSTLTKDEYEKIFKKQHSNIDSNGSGTVSQQEWKQLGK